MLELSHISPLVTPPTQRHVVPKLGIAGGDDASPALAQSAITETAIKGAQIIGSSWHPHADQDQQASAAFE